ncbi:MAG: ribosome maturation factor RimP [Solirubrobacteraceae bacterium]
MPNLQADVERRIAVAEPDVEVLLAEVLGGRTLRVYVDHPAGVTLGLCERVSALLGELRERYALEVSSPGGERPLVKPDHYRRYIGRSARVRVRAAEAASCDRQRGQRSERDAAQRHSFTGELVGATEQEVTLAAEDGIVAIPYSQIHRSNLVEE